MANHAPFIIGNTAVAPGERVQLSINMAHTYDCTPIAIPVEVIRGKKPGPAMFVSAAIHGDEIVGTEIIRRLLVKKSLLKKMMGTLVVVPIVNVFGYNRQSRYLPDRRDLNRCFPGSKKGSLAGQIAYTFMEDIVRHCDYGIDLHSGAIHRTNIPQIRACLDHAPTRELAEAFGVPIILNSDIRDGSLRQAGAELGIPMLLFEGGEALRYDEKVIQSGVNGIINVMEAIGMVAPRQRKKVLQSHNTSTARSSMWVRSPESGSLRLRVKLGQHVSKGQRITEVLDPFGNEIATVNAKRAGIAIGLTRLPLVNNGDAIVHLATFEDIDTVEEELDLYADNLADFI